ncbi:E3 ubiquitin-protein ligase SH3RF2 isoform X1 [Gallus gallus]|uniref:RING-type E3 ubiquitin transferase n=1 Tax=Gallus gallus TaxID=9031 RepID=A0A1L1RP76_CHICK|nr:E3 ubiquitin-protein ligase SH3RF2 isoform X1 [Gallus gallus]XP_040538464.1 E3 ubiquitin-protein ligase SH3RF2 isoform X1 [Gallus gallus]XP_040538465.1 E3 ubiquitin-protein ligase SH3RF2 isoform X1 [Gallus gallus]XP_414662.3 E3 ubiquitin-protein ligase SH3RF2 isoform X1 [Gallus gallus]|eukprot:XP_004945098.1 putative E3 ubiquitin-protein ligase SH3RF2 isoform X1 [Gallus gallus]
MDDLALLDLLECPVCFEKLDATAKVLPCQHTFCKPCLQRILKSQKELRCPECRTLVLCGIEQLPANLLLIRLLDGVRYGQNAPRFGSMQRSGLLSSPACIRRAPRGLQLAQYRPPTAPRSLTDGVPRAKALFSYRGHNPGELRFNKGDVIVLLRQLDQNWYLGELNGVSGVFPASSVQVIKQLPLPPPLCRALYNFDLRSRDKSENNDCLSFHKGDIITVISRVDGNWAEGKLGDKVGIFPVLFVEPNTTARQLLQSSKGSWPTPLRCAPLGMASPKAQGRELHKAPDARRKSLRPFSITTALNTLNRMVHAPADRPALRISSPVLISSSNPSVAAAGSEDAPRGTPAQVSASYYPAPGSLRHSAAIVTLPHLQHHLSANMKPSVPDSKLPTLYASWTLSAASLSSQGSASESAQRQSRALKAALPAGHTALRRGRGCTRKNGSLQRPGQAGLQAASSLRRMPTAGLQPYPHAGSPTASTAEVGVRPNFSHEAPPALVVRGGESRAPSVCSSVILDTTDPLAKSESGPRPPASAPPSILVKPDTSRNSSDKQVKTVRFQNHSPPPKRHSLQPSPRLPRSSTELVALAEPPLPEGSPELPTLPSPRLGSSPLHPRRALHPRAASLELSVPLTFPVRKSYSSVSAN